MIERILLALDADADTPIATHYALDIAKRHEARVTGLACVDTAHIESSASGGGIGSMYYAEQIKNQLTDETRQKATNLVQKFEERANEAGVNHADLVQEGVPFERILEDMKYHDLLVIGKEDHFFYADPGKNTATLERVVKETVAPVLIIVGDYKPVKQVVIAYDGSQPAARAMQHFAQMRPFGNDVRVRIVNVFTNEREMHEAERMCGFAQRYLESHGYTTSVAVISGEDPCREVLAYSEQINADLVVAGAHSVSRVRELAFGSTTKKMIEDGTIPLFLER